MEIELSRDEAEILRRLLQQRIEELDKEINRTDSLEFKHELQDLSRALERMLGQIAAAVARGRAAASEPDRRAER